MTRPIHDGSTFAAVLSALARHAPDRPALLGEAGALTYAELFALSGRMAAWLMRQGVQPGQMAGLAVRDELQHLIVSLALMRLGCDQVTLAAHEPAPLREELAARVRAAIVIGDDAADAIEGVPLLLPDHAAIRHDRGLDASAPPPNDAPARIIFTSSGTTGRPKLIPLTERMMLLQARGNIALGSVRHHPAPMQFNIGKHLRLQSIGIGTTEVVAPGLSNREMIALCVRSGVDRITLPPQRLKELTESDGITGQPWPPGILIVIMGGPVSGALRSDVAERLTPNLSITYGTIECGSVTQAAPAEHARNPEGVGRPVAGVEVEVVDDRGTRLPEGELGFVRIRTPGMTDRYLDDPAASARAFQQGWFHPGDLGRLDADGTLVFAGRGDDMMILGTINVFPAEIERVADTFPGVAECAAFPLRSAAHGDVPMLAVVARADGSLDEAALMSHCRQRLGMRAPRKILLLSTLPRNGTGKVLRRELSLAAAQGASRDASSS